MSESRLAIQAQPITFQAIVLPPPLEGVEVTELNLMSADTRYMLKLPRDMFPKIDVHTGEPLVVSLTLFRAVVEPVPEKLTDLAPKLILPNRGMN